MVNFNLKYYLWLKFDFLKPWGEKSPIFSLSGRIWLNTHVPVPIVTTVASRFRKSILPVLEVNDVMSENVVTHRYAHVVTVGRVILGRLYDSGTSSKAELRRFAFRRIGIFPR